MKHYFLNQYRIYSNYFHLICSTRTNLKNENLDLNRHLKPSFLLLVESLQACKFPYKLMSSIGNKTETHDILML